MEKQTSWISAFDAASVALLGLIAQRKRANDDADVAEGCTESALVEVAQSGYRSAADQKEPGQCGFHDSASKAASNQHHAEGKENETEGQEVHGSGRLEFRPDGAEPIRKEVLPANRTLGVLLYENGQLSRRSARPVGAIPQVSDRRFALGGEVIPGLIGLEGGEVGSEVHAPSKPCGCR